MAASGLMSWAILPYDYYGGSIQWKYLWQMLVHPLPESLGPQQFLAGFKLGGGDDGTHVF